MAKASSFGRAYTPRHYSCSYSVPGQGGGFCERNPTIVKKQISHVVIAIRDPHPKVNSEGIRMLREGGVLVTERIEEKAARKSLKDWLLKYE